MSRNGKISDNKPIGDLRDLKGPEIDELYLMSCNTANEMLMKYKGSNVADAFRDLPNVSKVYGYDGSMGYGDEFPPFRLIDQYYADRFDPRLSDEQSRFKAISSSYRNLLQLDPNQKQLQTYDGWFRYED